MAEIQNRFLVRSWAKVVRVGSQIPLIDRFLSFPPEIRKKILDGTDLKAATNLTLSCRESLKMIGYEYIYAKRLRDNLDHYIGFNLVESARFSQSEQPMVKARLRGSKGYLRYILRNPLNRLNGQNLDYILQVGTHEQISQALTICSSDAVFYDNNYSESIWWSVHHKDPRVFAMMMRIPTFTPSFDRIYDRLCGNLITAGKWEELDLLFRQFPTFTEQNLQNIYRSFFFISPYRDESYNEKRLQFLREGKMPKIPRNLIPTIFGLVFSWVQDNSKVIAYLASKYGYPMKIPEDNIPVAVVGDHGYVWNPQNGDPISILQRHGYVWNPKIRGWERNAWGKKLQL